MRNLCIARALFRPRACPLAPAAALALALATAGCSSSPAGGSGTPDGGASGPPTCGAGAPLVASTGTAARALGSDRYQLEAAARAGTCVAVGMDDAVVPAACSVTATAQSWDITALDGGEAKLEVGSTGKALNVAGAGMATGTAVITWPFGPNDTNSRFKPRDATGGSIELEAVNAPGMCVALTAKVGELQPCGLASASRFLARKILPPCGIAAVAAAGQCVPTPRLAVKVLSERRVAALGQSFDATKADLVPPSDWATNYGKWPEVIAVPDVNAVDVMYHDQGNKYRAYLVRLEPKGSDFVATRAFQVDLLGTLMGFARGPDGTYYFASGTDEGAAITPEYPPNGVHRANIVRVVGFDAMGCVKLDSDLDLGRGWRKQGSELVINPMVAATSHIAVGGGTLAIVHSTNTTPDPNLMGGRHQKALTSHIDLRTGLVVRTESMWVSHSFDQRIFWDGSAFVELHLGDAYPRSIALGRFTPSGGNGGYNLFQMKGPEGANSTYTRIGGIAPIASGPFGHVVVFTTDRDTVVPMDGTIHGNRDLALVRVVRDFDLKDPGKDVVIDTAAPGLQTPEVAGVMVENHLTWLTDYGASDGPEVSADRPRLVALGNDQYLVFWERWNGTGYEGLYRLEIDGTGAVTVEPKVVGKEHIPRDEDPVAIGKEAGFVLGAGKGLLLLLLDQDLNVRRVMVN